MTKKISPKRVLEVQKVGKNKSVNEERLKDERDGSGLLRKTETAYQSKPTSSPV